MSTGRARSLANLKPWQPGQTGNPSGRGGTLPPEIRALRKKNQAKVIELVNKLLSMTDQDAGKMLENPLTTQLERATQSVIAKAREGEIQHYKYLMELSLGRIPETDYDGFSEEDLRMLNRVKEILSERRSGDEPGRDRAGH